MTFKTKVNGVTIEFAHGLTVSSSNILYLARSDLCFAYIPQLVLV